MRRVILCLAAVLLLGGCGAKQQPASAQIFAMDTYMELQVYGSEELLTQVEELIYSLEKAVSVTDEQSELYAVNRDGAGELGELAAGLLTSALDMCRRTGGALDISVYPVVRAWGFTTGDYRVPEREELDALLELVDYTAVDFDGACVTLAEGMEIDLGSVAKGYAGEKAAELLRSGGVESALLNLGGNVQAVGSKPDGSAWRVAVKDPSGSGYLGIIELSDQAAVTSGGYERYFEQDGKTYWHIIDPATGCPAESGLISVTVVGDSGLTCDALSTALFVMGLDAAAEFWAANDDFEAVLVAENGEIYVTEGLSECFTPADESAEVTVIARD